MIRVPALVLLLATILLDAAGAAPAARVAARVSLGETIPIETALGDTSLPAARDVWLEMIRGARRSLDFEEFYLSTWPGEPMEEILDAIGKATRRGVAVRLLLDARMHDTYPRTADSLARLPGFRVRLIDVGKTTGGGVQHAKYFIADGSEVWLGSQNFDWRALKHIHELGVRIRDPRVAGEFGRVFEMDWARSVSADTTDASDPGDRPMPRGVATLPLRLVNAPGDTVEVWPSYSPRGFIPDSSRWDLDAITRRIDGAREEIVVQLLTYGLGRGEDRDSTIDQALRRAAARGVRVRLLVSDWMADRPAMRDLESLAAVPHVEVRLSVVPEWSGGYIPYARVEHCKAMIVDSSWTWIGTSNWEPSYFSGSRNIAVTLRNRKLALATRRIFETSWIAPTAVMVRTGAAYTPRVHGSTPPPGKRVYGE